MLPASITQYTGTVASHLSNLSGTEGRSVSPKYLIMRKGNENQLQTKFIILNYEENAVNHMEESHKQK